MNKELENFFEIFDEKIDALNLTLEKAQKICGEIIDDAKQFQAGLLPEEEVLPEDDFNREKEGETKSEFEFGFLKEEEK